MSNRSFEEYESEGQMNKLLKKSKDSPFAPIGMAGFFAVAALGLYNYKNRGNVSTSVYLMQLRVAAQGTVVGTLCLGLIYSMVDRYILNKRPTNSINAVPTSSASSSTTTSTNQH